MESSEDQKVRWYKSWLLQQHCFSMPLSFSYVLVIFFSVGSDWWSRTAGKAMSAPRCHDGVLTDPMLIHHNFLHFVLVYISNYIWHYYMTLYIIHEWIHVDTRYSGYFRLATPGSRKLLGSFQVQPIPLHFDHDRQDQGMVESAKSSRNRSRLIVVLNDQRLNIPLKDLEILWSVTASQYCVYVELCSISRGCLIYLILSSNNLILSWKMAHL